MNEDKILNRITDLLDHLEFKSLVIEDANAAAKIVRKIKFLVSKLEKLE